MSRAAALLGAVGIVTLLAASCAISGFEKVDAFSDTDASAGSAGSSGSAGSAGSGGTAGSAGSAGTAGGGTGGSGGAPPCDLGACSAGPNGEPACCFTASACGLLPSDYGVCLPPNGAGSADPGCADHQVGQATLDGCCMPNGLCGFVDASHGLGCMPAEAFGETPQACGSSACGEICVAAKAEQCSLVGTSALALYECANKCLSGKAQCTDELAAVGACATSGATGCASHGDPLFAGCLAEQLDFAECEAWPGDCALYCALVQSACTGVGLEQYTSEQECLAVCANLTPSTHATPTELTNSVPCRAQNAALALTGSKTELCPAAGPGGSKPTGPACGGGDCQSYCSLFKVTCADQFLADYADSQATCEAACSGGQVPNSPPYDVDGDQTGNTVQCRLYWTIRAIVDSANAAAHCEKAREVSTQCQ